MTTVGQRDAKRNYRHRQRAKVRSWFCVDQRHELCQGRLQRLPSADQANQRPACTCACHHVDFWNADGDEE